MPFFRSRVQFALPGLRKFAAPILLMTSGLLLAGTASGDTENKGVPILNGKDLSGWEGAPGWWKVEDGALTSESTKEKPCKKCNYLVWTGDKPADFELECEFKLSAAGNSGIQLRSEKRPDFDTFGYQADMTGDGSLIGFVYHHKLGLVAGRGQQVNLTPEGKREVTPLGDPAELLKHYKKEDWNHYRVVCKGPEITVTLNGVLMCKITDHDAGTAAREGIIALQMHPGPPMKVQFKNLYLKEMKSPEPKADPPTSKP